MILCVKCLYVSTYVLVKRVHVCVCVCQVRTPSYVKRVIAVSAVKVDRAKDQCSFRKAQQAVAKLPRWRWALLLKLHSAVHNSVFALHMTAVSTGSMPSTEPEMSSTFNPCASIHPSIRSRVCACVVRARARGLCVPG